MKRKLRILLVEDHLVDAELIAEELERDGFSFSLKRIETEAEFLQALAEATPDLVLSHHGLPTFSGIRALEIAREQYPELHFIFVSGSNDQAMVMEMYERGATDFVFKHDLGDLKSAVRQAFEASEMSP